VLHRLNPIEVDQWVQTHAPYAQELLRGRGSSTLELARGTWFPESSPASNVVYRCKRLIHGVADGARLDAILVVIDETGIWESSEHFPLYQLVIRDTQEVQSTFWKTPGYLFEGNSALDPSLEDHAVSLLVCCVLFGWGFVLIGKGSPVCVRANHDSIVEVGSDSSARSRTAAREYFDT
jgi:hypothetical protein